MEFYLTTATANTTETVDETLMFTVAKYLVAVRKFAICPAGVLINALCVAVLLRRSLRRMMLLPYLVALAVVDGLYLFMDLLNEVVGQLTTITSAYCKFSMYVALVSGAYSDFLIVAMAVSRLIAVSFPLKAHIINQWRTTMTVTVLLLVLVAGLYSVTLWTYGVYDGYTWCTTLPEYEHLIRFEVILGVTKTAVTSVAILLTTVAIVVKLRVNRRTIGMARSTNSCETHVTMMLLCTTTLFLVTNIPLSCYVFVQTFSDVDPETDFFIMALLLTIKALGLTCDFFLYFLASSVFRRQVKQLFVCQNVAISLASKSLTRQNSGQGPVLESSVDQTAADSYM